MLKTLVLLMAFTATTLFTTAWASDEPNEHAKSYSPKYKQLTPPPPEAEPEYFTMDKNVVNFRGEGHAKFLAVDIKFLSYYPELVGGEHEGIMDHLRPILKNDIDRVLRNSTYTELSAPDGPDKLRKKLLEVARKVLEHHHIYPDLLEDCYITKFVMQ